MNSFYALLMLATDSFYPLLMLATVSLAALTVALYYFVSRDTQKYRDRIEERMKQMLHEHGADASKRELELLKQELLSDIPAFHRLMLRFQVFNQLQEILRQADVKIVNVNQFILLSLLLGVLGGLILFFFSGSLIAMLMGTIVLAIAPLMFVRRKRRKRFQHFIEQLPDALELMIRSLQAGHSFSSALQMVATEMPEPISREFGKAYEEQNLGLNIKIALENLVERMPILDLKLCVTAVLIQREIGGNLSEVMHNISHTIRERFRIQGEIRVKSAQARLSGYIISALPAFLFFWINLINPNFMKPLYEYEYGMHIIVGAIVMQVVGWLIIRKIVSIEV
jgi:tight adherence protein B